jgi:hypothetical protein
LDCFGLSEENTSIENLIYDHASLWIMIEFNPDGSLKLPEKLAKKDEENRQKMRVTRCIRIKREAVNFSAPKKCVLHITLSDTMTDNRFMDTIFGYFKNRSSTPCKLIKINEREFDVEIGTDFRRCSDCQSLIGELRDYMDGNLIDVKGNCTYEDSTRAFAYEDYFS